MNEIKNVKITNVSLTMADHGCLTFYLTLEGDGWGINYGGYCIGLGFLGSDSFTAENGSGLVAIMRIMDTVGVERWENLKGKYIRIVDESWGSSVKKIGNIIEDKWFDIDEFFKNYNKENNDEKKKTD
jgi:hypothetical protein